MLFSRASLLLGIASLVAAAPLETSWLGSSAANGINQIFDFGKRHSWGSRQTDSGTCNTAAAQLPASSLPPLSPGLEVYFIAVGRGTQNYTCDTANSTAVPVAIGALADLFNVTCMAADYPVLLNAIPNIAVAIPTPVTTNPLSPAAQDLAGHHYFIDLTTPYFNLDTATTKYGQGGFKKDAAVKAPSTALPGSVDWLKLSTRDADQCAFQEVYRVNTAGGNPPATCAGQPASFQVQYSAEYWFFS